MLHLRSRLLPLLRVSSSSHASTSASDFPCLPHIFRLLLSASATATPFSIQDYLVGTCGLTGAQALKASKKLPHLKSATNLDAVLAALSCVGLSSADLAAVVAADPLLLGSKANNVARRIASLRDRVGLSDPPDWQLSPAGGAMAVHRCDVAQRLEFWIPFLDSFGMFLKIFKGNSAMVTADLEKVIKPNIALLQQCGLTVRDIVKMFGLARRLLTRNPKKVEAFVRRADKLGVPRTSGRFEYMVAIVGSISEGSATARMKYLGTTLGCSMDEIRDMVCKTQRIIGFSEGKLRSNIEVLSSTLGCSIVKIYDIVCKAPNILGFSEKNLSRKIDFLVTNVGLEPEYISSNPVLLTLSLQKRLAPRHYVVQLLEAKWLIKDVAFCTYAILGEKDFVGRYIDRHKNAVPGLKDAYATVCAGKLSPELQPSSD